MKPEVTVSVNLALDEEKTIKTVNNLLKFMRDEGYSRKGVSDGYHTFEELYYHRMVLFSIICNQNKDKAWKSKKHHDGSMFDDTSFIVGVETTEGQYTYHYHLEYWDHFDVKVLEFAPQYDGHKPSDIGRLRSLL
ncbi:WDGH domain-containing protein [Guggenheimella bovis]